MHNLKYEILFFCSFTFLFFFFSIAQQGPGSGRCLVFSNSSSNRVNIPDAAIFDHPGNNITMEAWIYPTSYTSDGTMIFSKTETNGTREYYIYIEPSGVLRFILIDNLDVAYFTRTTTLIPLNTWTHVAATYSYATGIAKVYLNGILSVSNTIGSIVIESSSVNPLIGAYWLSNNSVTRSHFQGTIDEVRLWYIERTQTEIRDNMCRMLVLPQANLIAYYRLDEASGLTVNDASGNGNNGIMQNFTAAQVNGRNYSGAPIGNESVNQYPAGVGLTLGSTPPGADEGAMTIDNITGSPSGIHLYRVDELPSQMGGLYKPLSTYFGTFVVGSTTPTYRATYNYSGTILDNHICENNLKLYQRNDNSVPTWVSLNNTLDIAANTLTALNADNTSRKEIILDTYCSSLPVDFISFEVGISSQGGVALDWVTSSEKNNDYFQIERSKDLINFEEIGKVAGNSFSNEIRKYTFNDTSIIDGVSYYRIKLVDFDGNFTYTSIKSVNNKSIISCNLYPNPGDGSFHFNTNQKGSWEISIYDIKGIQVYNYVSVQKNLPQEIIIKLNEVPKGLYFLKLSSEAGIVNEKLIIQ